MKRWSHVPALGPGLVLGVALGACATRPPLVAELPHPAGSAAWDAAVKRAFLRHDGDGSGLLEAPEVAAVACPEWQRVDAALVADTGSHLAVVYGVDPGLIWRGADLGMAEGARETAAARLGACLGPARAEDRDQAALLALADLGFEPATDAWDAAVHGVLLTAYDLDGSGALDSASELEAVPCDVWRALEDTVLSARGQPLMVIYGFSDGYVWAGDALGFDQRIAMPAVAAMSACGLATD
ncbi:MAG: hypothetical protein U1F43_01030 [Myxococcota bacterium]